MKKTIILLAVLLTLHSAAGAQTVDQYKARYNDSCYRIKELQQLTILYNNTVADLKAVVDLREAIDEYHIGRTQAEKIDQQNENDKLQIRLVARRDNVIRTLRQKAAEWKKIYAQQNP
jgi:hypothetical protein